MGEEETGEWAHINRWEAACVGGVGRLGEPGGGSHGGMEEHIIYTR